MLATDSKSNFRNGGDMSDLAGTSAQLQISDDADGPAHPMTIQAMGVHPAAPGLL